MSQRGKRQNRFDNDEQLPSKKRKGRPPAKATTAAAYVEDEMESGTSSAWQPRPITDLKISSIYNRSAPEAPAELFRKDLISAMKLPDSEPLVFDDYWSITDQWKQEWERGVQVPVNPDSLPEPTVSAELNESFYTGRQDFKLPKNKFIRITKDDNFSSDFHYLSNTPAMADAACEYDLDQYDNSWLNILNGERAMAGIPNVSEEQFERVIEELEVRCWDKIQSIINSEDCLGIEYDENVICDVCRSPDSEEANEMVFCDSCNICVHQACYGITAIPEGQWLCRSCSMSQKPDCVLCPNQGGAMKSTRSGQKWAHVSCALWIPEVSIGSVDRMEPITKISSIPQSRWALICVLCRARVGACIQCSVKTCKTAYHVTCAFKHGLEMRAIIEDENAEDGVKLRSYCLKHSMNKNKKDKSSNNNAGGSGSEDEDSKRKKQRKDMTTEERNLARVKRLQEVESEFDKHVNVRDISCHILDVDQEAIYCIYNYWILKRKSNFNRPLLPPRTEDVDMIEHKQEPADIQKMKTFVHLRQDLERVRNLCYMVSRREKLSRSFFKMREQTFHKQISVLSEVKTKKIDDSVIKAVCQANHGPSIYDKLYSSDKCSEQLGNLEEILARLSGEKSPKTQTDFSDRKTINKLDINGIVKNNKRLLLCQSSEIQQQHHHQKHYHHYHHHHHHQQHQQQQQQQQQPKQTKQMCFNGLALMPAETTMKTTTTIKSGGNIYDSLSSESGSDKRYHLRSSSNDDERPTSEATTHIFTNTKKKLSVQKRSAKNLDIKAERRQRRTSGAISRLNKVVESSSDDDSLHYAKDVRVPKNRLLRQMERELIDDKLSCSESDDLVTILNSSGQPIGSAENKKISEAIYSDSEDSTDKEKTDNTASDSQQHPFRTKAAMKEFNVNAAAATKITNKNGNEKSLIAKSEEKLLLETEKQEKEKLDRENIERDLNEKFFKEEEIQQREKLEKEKDRNEQLLKEKKHQPIEKVERERIHIEKIDKENQLKEQIEHNRHQKEKTENEKVHQKQLSERKGKLKQNERTIDKKFDKSKGFPNDLLVVPQRKAAKKASENMMKSTVVGTSKKDIKDIREEDRIDKNREHIKDKIVKDMEKDRASVEAKEIVTDISDISKTKGRPAGKNVVHKHKPTKEKADSKLIENVSKIVTGKFTKEKSEKDILVTYVPQRQAAKKAAEHIKSGLGKPNVEAIATNAALAVQPEVEKSHQSQHQLKKDENKTVSVSSSSCTGSSSGSSSYSSSSSSSDSEEDTAKNKNKDSKSDKAKELPFLNKEPKSPGYVTSNDSSNSDTTTNSSENSKQSTRKNNQKKITSTTKKKTTTTTPKKNLKESENKFKTSEVDRTPQHAIESFSLSIKREEKSATRTKILPKSVRRRSGSAKKQSVSDDKCRSIDIKSGNLAKCSKTSSPEFESSKKNENESKQITSKAKDISPSNLSDKSPISPARIETTAQRKRKSNLLEESATIKSSQSEKLRSFEFVIATNNREEKTGSLSTKSTSGINTSNTVTTTTKTPVSDKKSSKSSQLFAEERKTNEKLSATVENDGNCLEKEIIERKAELSASFNNKLSKGACSLNTLLGKRQKDVLCAVTHQSPKENNNSSNEDADGKPTEITETLKRSNKNDTCDVIKKQSDCNIDIIYITTEIIEKPKVQETSIDMDIEQALVSANTEPKDENFKPYLFEEKLVKTGVFTKSSLIENKSRSIFSSSAISTNDKNDPMSIFNFVEKDFGTTDDPFSLPTTADATTGLLFSYPTDNIFKQDFKEDSAKETMDLVGKLRQRRSKKTMPESSDEKSASQERELQIIEIDTSPEETMDISDKNCLSVEQSDQLINKKVCPKDVDFIIDLDPEDSKEEKKLDRSVLMPTDERWIPPSTPIRVDQLNSNSTKLNHDQTIPSHSDITVAQDFLEHMQEQTKYEPAILENSFHKQLLLENANSTRQNLQAVIVNDSDDQNDQSPYMRSVNKWTENSMIQTRRSVSSSPSSASECNEDDMLPQQQQQEQQQEQQQHRPSCHLIQEKAIQHHKQLDTNESQPPHMRNNNDMPIGNIQPDLQSFEMANQAQNQMQQMKPFDYIDINNSSGKSSQYTGPVSTFPSRGSNVQLTFPSPSVALFPPTIGQQSSFSTRTSDVNQLMPLQQPSALQQPSTLQQQSALQQPSALPEEQHHQQQLQNQPQQQQKQQQQQPQIQQQESQLLPQQHILPILKPVDLLTSTSNPLTYPSNTCEDAFTSSLHNMALTAAIVSPTNEITQMLQQQQQQQHMQHLQHQLRQQEHHNLSIIQQDSRVSINTMLNHSQQQCVNFLMNSPPSSSSTQIQLQSTMPFVKISHIESEKQKSSPPKRSMRMVAQQAAQNISQQLTKSPNKSPSKSPRQLDVLRLQQLSSAAAKGGKVDNASVRGRTPRAPRSTASNRGGKQRGRGRGRLTNVAPPTTPYYETYDSNIGGTIHNKLIGTVYDLDFDEDFAGENVENYKTLRDRRRSIDCRMESYRGSRDASQSPKFASPNSNKNRIPFNQSDIRDLQPPSPMGRARVESNLPESSIHIIVPPLLPGPVDMRTYNFDSTNTEAYNSSLLDAFATGTANQPYQDIDEEMEKELQSALKASNTKPTVVEKVDAAVSAVVQSEEAVIDSNTVSNSRVSLFKLKIKGPHAHPDNYTSTQVQQQSVILDVDQQKQTNVQNFLVAAPPVVNSNLRRMRKKELLRQYCAQDMNMDDSNCASQADQTPAFVYTSQTISRSVGIPKAVDSMSSIPTKDDYKDQMDMKKRKAGVPREIRQLDIHDDTTPERRRSVCSNTSNTSATNQSIDSTKRMTRTQQQAITMPTPKLKIKIGVNSMDATLSEESRVRPPKKRLANMPVPSLEDLKRECMNYRKQVMGEFDQAAKDKSRKSKSSKSERKEERRKRKKEKKQHKVKIINSAVTNDPSTKLIIRFGKRKAEDLFEELDPLALPEDPLDMSTGSTSTKTVNSHRASSNKEITEPIITPIRLKLARSLDGGGYVMANNSKIAATATKSRKDIQSRKIVIYNDKVDDNDDTVGDNGSTSEINLIIEEIENSNNSTISDDKPTIEKRTKKLDPDPPPSKNIVTLSTSIKPIDFVPVSKPSSSFSPTLLSSSVSVDCKKNENNDDPPTSSLTSTESTTSTSQGCLPLPLSKDCEVR